jgi:hypothetical protein
MTQKTEPPDWMNDVDALAWHIMRVDYALCKDHPCSPEEMVNICGCFDRAKRAAKVVFDLGYRKPDGEIAGGK